MANNISAKQRNEIEVYHRQCRFFNDQNVLFSIDSQSNNATTFISSLRICTDLAVSSHLAQQTLEASTLRSQLRFK